MQGQVRVSGDGPIPDADVFRNKFRAASASSVSISSSSLDDTARNDADRHRKRDERDPADPKAQHPDRRGPAGKAKEEKKKEKSDKTYRLFVVAAT